MWKPSSKNTADKRRRNSIIHPRDTPRSHFEGGVFIDKEKIWQRSFQMLLAPTEETENQRHLEGIGYACEYSSADGGVTDPEGSDCVPKEETEVMPPAETLRFGLGGNLLGKK